MNLRYKLQQNYIFVATLSKIKLADSYISSNSYIFLAINGSFVLLLLIFLNFRVHQVSQGGKKTPIIPDNAEIRLFTLLAKNWPKC